jgi:colanic acid/amylovoran biosynthesis protein
VNVLIVNGYSARNRGDGMIINQMIRLFRERGCAVRLMSDDPEDRLRDDVAWEKPIADIWPDPRVRRSRLTTAGNIVRCWIRPPAERAAFRWADVCVSAGGGYLYDDGGRASRVNLVRRLLPLRAARRAGVPVVLFSQSIGPFASPLSARLAGAELRRADLVIVREELSLDVCRALGVAAPALCDDVAFALRPDEEPVGASLPQVDRPAIGVTVMSALPGVDADGCAHYHRALLEGLVQGLQGRGEDVLVVSQVAAHATDDDRMAAAELADALERRGRRARFVDLGHESDAGLTGFYGALELVVASRLHSGILALCAGTPIVALSYLPKTDGVVARLGWGELVLPARGLDADALARTLASALARKDDLRRELSERLPAIRRSAEAAADLTLAAAARRPAPPARRPGAAARPGARA